MITNHSLFFKGLSLIPPSVCPPIIACFPGAGFPAAAVLPPSCLYLVINSKGCNGVTILTFGYALVRDLLGHKQVPCDDLIDFSLNAFAQLVVPHIDIYDVCVAL